MKCNRRFTTYEKIERIPLMVIKKDGRREEFERAKILSGLKKASEKRPLSMEKLEHIVKKVEKELEARNKLEIPSSAIGKLILAR